MNVKLTNRTVAELIYRIYHPAKFWDYVGAEQFDQFFGLTGKKG